MANRDLDIQNGVTYPLTTDLTGGALNLFPGYSTGLGRAFVSIKKGGVALTSGSTLNTFVDGLIIGGFKALTDAMPINILSIAVASNTMASGILNFTIEAKDATNLQLDTGHLTYAVVNKAGVFTTILTDNNKDNEQILTTGSVTVTFALTSANPAVLSINVNTSLTPSAGFPRINFSIQNLGNQAITLL